MTKTYGYVRVSSRDQNEERQLIALRECGVDEKLIIIDKQSGKDFDRPGYKRLMKRIKPGDTLIIKSIDRLGRNYDEILDQWRILTKEKQAQIADIVLQLLSYVAQTEREFIRQRQREGIEAARQNGVHLGRRSMERPDSFEMVRGAWENGELSCRAAAKLLGVSHTTFRNWCKLANSE